MVEVILGLVIIHIVICLVLAALDLYFGYSSGYKIDSQFVIHTLIGAFLWPIGLSILWSWKIFLYFRKK